MRNVYDTLLLIFLTCMLVFYRCMTTILSDRHEGAVSLTTGRGHSTGGDTYTRSGELWAAVPIDRSFNVGGLVHQYGYTKQTTVYIIHLPNDHCIVIVATNSIILLSVTELDNYWHNGNASGTSFSGILQYSETIESTMVQKSMYQGRTTRTVTLEVMNQKSLNSKQYMNSKQYFDGIKDNVSKGDNLVCYDCQKNSRQYYWVNYCDTMQCYHVFNLREFFMFKAHGGEMNTTTATAATGYIYADEGAVNTTLTDVLGSSRILEMHRNIKTCQYDRRRHLLSYAVGVDTCCIRHSHSHLPDEQNNQCNKTISKQWYTTVTEIKGQLYMTSTNMLIEFLCFLTYAVSTISYDVRHDHERTPIINTCTEMNVPRYCITNVMANHMGCTRLERPGHIDTNGLCTFRHKHWIHSRQSIQCGTTILYLGLHIQPRRRYGKGPRVWRVSNVTGASIEVKLQSEYQSELTISNDPRYETIQSIHGQDA